MEETVKRKTDEERKAALAKVIASKAAIGFRVDSQSDFQAVLVWGKPVNHVLHAILTFFTCFVWGIVWLILGLTQGEKRELVQVDEWGNIVVAKIR